MFVLVHLRYCWINWNTVILFMDHLTNGATTVNVLKSVPFFIQILVVLGIVEKQ